MCSRLLSGSAEMPTSPSSPDDRGRDALARRARVATLGRRRERAQDGQRQPRVAARRIDRDVGRLAEAADALAILAPLGEPVLPGLGRLRGQRLDGRALARRFGRVDPGLELRGAEAGKGQHQVRDVALRVDHERRDAVERGLLEQRDAKARLAAAGHADADRVGRQVPRVVHQRLRGEHVLRGVIATAEVERAQFFVVRHGAIIRREIPCYFAGP